MSCAPCKRAPLCAPRGRAVKVCAPSWPGKPAPPFIPPLPPPPLDYGWNNIGIHAKSQPNAAEVVTPNIDALAAEGIILDRFYAYRFCSPSRSSFLSGRNPIHVNTGNDPLTLWNPQDPISGYAGIPINMTTIASKLLAKGYETAQAGKWHVRCAPLLRLFKACFLQTPYHPQVGLATETHTPKGRGFKHSLTYLDGANDFK